MLWISFFVLAALLVLIGIWFLHRFFAKATLDTALVRTGFGGRRVITDGGCVSLPILHQLQKVSMGALSFSTVRAGRDAVLTQDQMRADITFEFELRVDPTPDGIATAAQALGQRIARGGDTIHEVLSGALVNAIQNAAATRTLQGIHLDRSGFAQEVSQSIEPQAQALGLTLISASLISVDQSDLSQLNENNAFNALGMRRLAELVADQRKERVRIETEGRTKAAQVAQDELLRRAEMAALLALEEAKIANDIQLAHKRAEEAEAKASEEKARSLVILAAEKVQADKDCAVAQRERDVARIQQEKELELEGARVQRDVDTLLAKVQAEETAATRTAQAERAKMEAQAAGQLALNSAENTLSDAVIRMRLEERKLDRMPEIMTQMMKPVEKIDSIKINQISGAGGSGSEAGQGVDGAFGAAMDQILGMAVRLPAMKQMGEEIGLDFDANLAGRTADYANRIKPKQE